MRPAVSSEKIYRLPFPAAQVWPVLSKTDWLNRSLGLPPVKYELKPLPGGGTDAIATARIYGQALRWKELPFEWVENQYYRITRIFETGPLAQADGGMDFEPAPDGGTQVRILSSFTPRHLAGAALARMLLRPKTDRAMAAIVEHVNEYLAGAKTVILPRLPRTEVNGPALDAALQKLRAQRQFLELIPLFEAFLRESPDVELLRLRPFTLAKTWRRDRWEVLSLCLHATRAGLLDLSWEVLCPNCRTSPKIITTALAELHRTVHCEACHIDVNAEFDKSVELKFAINAAIRKTDKQIFCLSGPGAKPHIISQITIPPGISRAWKLPPLSGVHRLRSPQVRAPLTLNFDHSLGRKFICRPECFEESASSGTPNIEIVNTLNLPLQIILERMQWDEDILTAAQVTNWQEFRDLFSAEVLSPFEQITVGEQIILFTDLRGSTALYCGIGDAPAYALVRDHFAILSGVVRQHHGSVVKTIGDAVMAVFSQLSEALAAVEEMHQKLSESKPIQDRCLTLKSSLHAGPCLAVNANDRLDFFGTTINLAARMVDCCQGGDVTVSDEILARPEGREFLARIPSPPQPMEVKFRGFDAPQKVWRFVIR